MLTSTTLKMKEVSVTPAGPLESVSSQTQVQRITDLFFGHCKLVLSFLKFQINEIRWYVLLCVWLPSPSVRVRRFVCVICISPVPSPSTAEQCLSIRVLANEHWGCLSGLLGIKIL